MLCAAGLCARLAGVLVGAGADSGRSIDDVQAWHSWVDEVYQSQQQLYVEAQQPRRLDGWPHSVHRMCLCSPNEHCRAPVAAAFLALLLLLLVLLLVQIWHCHVLVRPSRSSSTPATN